MDPTEFGSAKVREVAMVNGQRGRRVLVAAGLVLTLVALGIGQAVLDDAATRTFDERVGSGSKADVD